MNKTVITENVLQAIWACGNALALKDDPFIQENYESLRKNLENISKAFSGSWIGYHANVYYRNLQIPRPGDHFSSEWGLMERYSNPTSENWIEYPREDIEAAAMTEVDLDYMVRARKISRQAREAFEEHYDTILTLVVALQAEDEAAILSRLKEDLEKIKGYHSPGKIIEAMRPDQVMTRDSTALSQGLITPVHCAMRAEQTSLFSPFTALEQLVKCSRRLLKYMEIHSLVEKTSRDGGDKVFIGHGRSPVWRELKDFLQDRLHLNWEEFNRQPTAGIATIERLQEMLDESCFAFLVMTGEDQHTDQRLHARENVVHEAGLFQGRLGFRKAVLLLEEGCSEFSDIFGLGQIRFPKGNIRAAFEEVRRVLEREGII